VAHALHHSDKAAKHHAEHHMAVAAH
jgi:hypothetical protein